jgi:hypothetical protein
VRSAWWPVALLVTAAAAAGCKGSSPAATGCPAAPSDPTCPDAIPSFANDVFPNVFVPACVPCHSPASTVDPGTPFTTYQQIYGPDGSNAHGIYFQVFEECLMPPPNEGYVLSDDQKQKLLDWLACGAPDS